MSLVEDSLRVLHFQEPPSSDEFSSKIEPKNVPAVFHGAIGDWDAVSKWNPAGGGLDYLEETVGSADVDAMQSKSAPVFYGDLRSHERPLFLAVKRLVSINLWMNKAGSRSSTHYDPYHNLLCIVAGSKKVVLWPPAACPVLYPMPIYGESSNHSAVDIENADFSVHTRAKGSKEYSQTVILHPGDALFIPEGWFHQVDSNDLTIAVNFWWKSYIMSNMAEHMDGYYLRRILIRLAGNEMKCMLDKASVGSLRSQYCEPTIEESTGCNGYSLNGEVENVEGNKEDNGLVLQQLEPLGIKAIYELISLVHESVKVEGQNETLQCTSSKGVVPNEKCKYGQIATDNSSPLDTDPVAIILSAVEPLVLKKVLLALVNRFPRTLEALILHVLSPIGAEVLTRKFDEMDRLTTKEEQVDFYQLFYSVFDDPCAAMSEILNKKERFSFQAVENVLSQYLGLCVKKPK